MTKKTSSTMMIAVVGSLAILGAVAGVQFAFSGDAPEGAVVLPASDLKWADAEGMPAGTQIAVLSGDPTKAGAFVIRLKLPEGWKIPAHTHPSDENVTVLSGATAVGFGDKFDEAALNEVGPLGFVKIPAGVRHFAQAKAGATIEVHGMGPWGVEYVDAANDPRHTGH